MEHLMNLDIRSRGFDLTSSLRLHTERQLAFALSRFAPRIGVVLVRLEDTNGPKGGADKRCRIEARLEGHAPLVAEVTGADLYGAIDSAAERMGRAVSRSVSRTLDRSVERNFGRDLNLALDQTIDQSQA